eukprot:6730902-Ditylum_brightwellii.AAC.1
MGKSCTDKLFMQSEEESFPMFLSHLKFLSWVLPKNGSFSRARDLLRGDTLIPFNNKQSNLDQWTPKKIQVQE